MPTAGTLSGYDESYASDSSTSSSGNFSFSPSSDDEGPTSGSFISLPDAPDVHGQNEKGHLDDDEPSEAARYGTPYQSDSSSSPIDPPLTCPRRVFRRRRIILDCLEAACLIISRSPKESIIDYELERIELQKSASSERQVKGGKKKLKSNATEGRLYTSARDAPWERLLKGIKEIRDGELVETVVTDKTSSLLEHLFETYICPLSATKPIITLLSGSESRSARSIRTLRPNPPASPPSPNSFPPDLLAVVPCFLLLRFARFALAHIRGSKVYLDLSRLPYVDSKTALEEMDFAEILGLVGKSVESVSHLDLSRNHLHQFPQWPNFPLPHVQVLNVSYNPLRTIPYPLIYLAHLRRMPHRQTLLSHPTSSASTTLRTHFWGANHTPLAERKEGRITLDKKQISSLKKRERGVASLVELSILSIVRQRMGLLPTQEWEWRNEMTGTMAPQLEERLEQSYVCERCFQLHIPPAPEIAHVTKEVRERLQGGKVWDARAKTGWQIRKQGKERKGTVWLEMVVCPQCLYHILASKSGR
ncbi:hypothetical protein IAR50_005558 [Cryptococcus sp. DSM 104548]